MRRVYQACVMIVFAVLFVSGDGRAQGPAVDDEQVRSLVSRLSTASFDVRRDAEAQLRRLDPSALPVLRRTAEAAEPGVRQRLERIILDVERRAITTALDDLEGDGRLRIRHVLHGWEAFSEQLGDSDETRRLYAEMMRAEPSLLRSLDEDAAKMQEAFETRCADLSLQRTRRPSGASIPTVAALLFVGGQSDCRPSPMAAGCVNLLVQQGEFRAALNRPHPPPILQELLGRWIARPETSTAMQRLSLAASFELPEGLQIAREMIDNRLWGPQIQYAVLYIAKMGDPQDMHVLEQLLDDSSRLQQARRGGGRTFTSQLRDLALIGLLHMTGQSVRDYGFVDVHPHPQYLFTPGTVGFSDDAQRRQALEKWRRWQAIHLRAVTPEPVWAVEGVTL